METFDNLKLYYFNVKVLGEPIRFIFHYAGLKFEDVRVGFEDWPTLKPNLAWGKMPVVQFTNSSGEAVELTQSATIARYFAKKFNLEGTSDWETAKASEYVDCAVDFRQAWRLYNFEPDEEKKEQNKKNFREVICPIYLSKYNKILEDSGENGRAGKFLLKSGVSYADFFVVVFLELFEETVDPNLLNDYPNLQNLKKNVYAIPQIAEWIAKRPTTKF